MANLSAIIAKKGQNDERWKAQKMAERENAVAMQDAGFTEIAGNPEAYARYLDLQGGNPMYSPGNIILAMMQKPALTVIGTADRWKTLGRRVKDGEIGNGVQIFARSNVRLNFNLTDAYDISQTTGREVKALHLENNSKAMESALATLLNFSTVPIRTDAEMEEAAYYDADRMELFVNPNVPDDAAFAAIAAEVAHSRFHGKGANSGYDRAECDLDAQSVSYLLCKRFGVERALPDLSGLAEIYSEWTPQEIREALNAVQGMSKQIGGAIDWALTPQQHSRGQAPRRSAR